MNSMSNPLEIVECQNEIIRIQSGVIDELFLLLLQHVSVEETDMLPAIHKINEAARLRREIGGEP